MTSKGLEYTYLSVIKLDKSFDLSANSFNIFAKSKDLAVLANIKSTLRQAISPYWL
jgi:hypothetical protein